MRWPASIRFALALALGCALLPGGGAAQEPAGPTPRESPEDAQSAESEAIVVEGQRRERRELMRSFTEQVTRPPRYAKPMARFLEPVCPHIWGMKKPYAEILRARIIENLEAMDIRHFDDEECRPNLYVVFASDLDEGMRKIVEETTMLKELHSYEIDRIVEEEGPVRAFSLAGLRDKNGRPLKMSPWGPVNDAAQSSRLGFQVTQETVGAFVAIDVAALDGKTFQQLADYATFRGLTQVDPARGGDLAAFETILTLFEPDGVAPGELSQFDRAYIRTLYHSPKDLRPADLYQRIAMNFDRLETREGKALD